MKEGQWWLRKLRLWVTDQIVRSLSAITAGSPLLGSWEKPSAGACSIGPKPG